MEAVPELVTIWHRPEGRRQWRHLTGDPALVDRWSEEDVALRGDVFTQVNRETAGQLERFVVERALAGDPGTAVDAYSGLGLYSRALTDAGVDVTAIESHPEAVAQAQELAPEATVLHGAVQDELSEVLPVDLAILNPPRTGVDRAVTEVLRAEGPDRILYVSCDPATLARDLRRLAPRYRTVNIESFDLFPQTAHVETVVELERCATT